MLAIPDRSAMMLMARFYELWRSGERSLAEALREAQRWVRDSTNAEKQAALLESTQPAPASAAAARLWLTARDTVDPVHWAAFTYHGG
jgi:CHAT domain-containing protein